MVGLDEAKIVGVYRLVAHSLHLRHKCTIVRYVSVMCEFGLRLRSAFDV